ncbi:hypothetical protein L7F22_022631 [Adiantum nelumboides]|nr:hypothetical protein [Adiantum nelumboides]
MKQFLTEDAKDKVLTAWRELKLEKGESIQQYINKFWDLHFKAIVFKKIDFVEQRQQYYARLTEDIRAYVNDQKLRTIAEVIHRSKVTMEIFSISKGAPKPFERNEKIHGREQVSKDSKGNGSKGKKDKVDINSLILFDPGSTHNFISIELAQKLGIQTEEMGTALEALGAFKGQYVPVTPLIGKLRVHVQGYMDQEEFCISPLATEDMILGAPWFHRLAAVLEYPTRNISFNFRNRDINIHTEDRGSIIPIVSHANLQKSMKSNLFAYMNFAQESKQHELSVEQKDQQEFLNSFKDCFADEIPRVTTFAWLMKKIFRKHSAYTGVFFDDIIVHSQTLEEHKKHLQSVFDELQANKLFVNGKKSEFFMKEIKYLGHIISKEGIRMDPEKLRVIDEWPEPCSVHELRSFLGMCSYYRRFIRDFSMIAGPLHDLTKKKTKYVWTPKENTAFMQLKAKLMTQPLLVLPDLKKPFEVHCDACGDSIGAVLSQEGHPIAYESRRLNPQERGLGVYEKEIISVIHAL